MSYKPLREYVFLQDLLQENDIETIIRYLTENELELELVDIIVSLLKSSIHKKDDTLQRSRAWIPQLFANSSINTSKYVDLKKRTNADEQSLFDKLTAYYLLGMSIPEHDLEKAKEIIDSHQKNLAI